MTVQFDPARGFVSFDPDPIGRAYGEEPPPSALPAILVPVRDASWDEKLFGLFVTARALSAEAPPAIPYIVRGLLATGALTELAGKVKVSGKTTFTLALVLAVTTGRPFAGLTPTRTGVVYLTEQGASSFLPALERAGLTGSDQLTILPWHRAAGIPWPAVVKAAAAKATSLGAGLLVVDTIGQWAGLRGDDENSAGAALAAVQPLQLAAAEGLAVLVIRHSRKSGGDLGDEGRGSSAFSGAVDILLSLRRAEGNQPRVRILHGLSRFGETPETITLELLGSGEYVALGDAATSAIALAKRDLLACAPRDSASALTIDALATGAKVRRSTAEAAADELVRDGWLIRSGAGKRGSPFLYGLSDQAGDEPDRAGKPVPTSIPIGDEKAAEALHRPRNGHAADGIGPGLHDQMYAAALTAFGEPPVAPQRVEGGARDDAAEVQA